VSLDRIVVVGGTGAGKTTVARRLAVTIDAPHVELDALWWQPGWQARTAASMRAEVAARLGDRWVVDGFYVDEVGDLVWPRADLVVWLDLPRRTCVRRAVLRAARRRVSGAELWNGNRESWAVLSPRSVWRLWKRWPTYPDRVAERLARHEGDVLRLRTPAAVRRWLEEFVQTGRSR
jgi:adenylate kinase family enzyme